MYEYTFTRKQTSAAPIFASSAQAIVDATVSAFSGAESERLVVVALSAHNEVLGYEVTYTGSVASVGNRMAELFRLPVRLNAKRMVVMHNHPMGYTSPSEADIAFTKKVVEAGRLLDIDVVDHIIVSHWGVFTSLRDMGMEMGA